MDTAELVEPVAAPVDVSESLADHEASFGRSGAQPAAADASGDADASDRDESGRFRHRAASQKAGPDDVATINTLTKELRAKEQELAKLDPDGEKDSPRIRSLKRQLAAVDASLNAKKAPKAAEPAPVAEPAPARPPVAAKTGTFDKPKPTIASLTAQGVADPYEALPEALLEWRDEQRAFEAAQKTHETQAREWEAKQQQAIDKHRASVAEFRKSHPDWDDVLNANTATNVSPVMLQALLQSDAAIMYHLAKQPSFSDELFTQTAAVDANHPRFWDLVASTQRRLSQHAQAATTGSAAVARPTYTPPASPPNPVRTGPIRTGDDPPSDESSLAEHERAYGAKKGRR